MPSQEIIPHNTTKIRLAKRISHSGYTSRRQAEELILNGVVKVDNVVVTDPVTFVSNTQQVSVYGNIIANCSIHDSGQTTLWRYYKPRGVMTTNYDPGGRPTVFEMLPKNFPNVMAVGRLDYNSEGLLLLTNDGQLSRFLELPASGFSREYRCRVFGSLTNQHIQAAKAGLTIDGIRYRNIIIKRDNPETTKAKPNFWLTVTLVEGKNREIRTVLSYFGLEVSRLIRTGYAGINLNALNQNEVVEVDDRYVLQYLDKMHEQKQQP